MKKYLLIIIFALILIGNTVAFEVPILGGCTSFDVNNPNCYYQIHKGDFNTNINSLMQLGNSKLNENLKKLKNSDKNAYDNFFKNIIEYGDWAQFSKLINKFDDGTIKDFQKIVPDSVTKDNEKWTNGLFVSEWAAQINDEKGKTTKNEMIKALKSFLEKTDIKISDILKELYGNGKDTKINAFDERVKTLFNEVLSDSKLKNEIARSLLEQKDPKFKNIPITGLNVSSILYKDGKIGNFDDQGNFIGGFVIDKLDSAYVKAIGYDKDKGFLLSFSRSIEVLEQKKIAFKDGFIGEKGIFIRLYNEKGEYNKNGIPDGDLFLGTGGTTEIKRDSGKYIITLTGEKNKINVLDNTYEAMPKDGSSSAVITLSGNDVSVKDIRVIKTIEGSKQIAFDIKGDVALTTNANPSGANYLSVTGGNNPNVKIKLDSGTEVKVIAKATTINDLTIDGNGKVSIYSENGGIFAKVNSNGKSLSIEQLRKGIESLAKSGANNYRFSSGSFWAEDIGKDSVIGAILKAASPTPIPNPNPPPTREIQPTPPGSGAGGGGSSYGDGGGRGGRRGLFRGGLIRRIRERGGLFARWRGRRG